MSRAKRKHPVQRTSVAVPPPRRRYRLMMASLLAGIALPMVALLLIHRPFAISAPDSQLPTPNVQLDGPRVNSAPAPENAPEGMVWIPGGVFHMGVDPTLFPPGKAELLDAQPVHLVYVDGFWMDKTEVTNQQFEEFVKATGYVTIAEQKPAEREAFSFVFASPHHACDPYKENVLTWLPPVDGANWRHPEGPKSDLKGRENHPVVHIAHDDAVAYCRWAKKRLPTEAEWEFAARGGLDRQCFCWGNDFSPSGKSMTNNWQGFFPNTNECKDGFPGTAPVGSFPPNAFGLFDMSGNAWEWCSDWYHPQYYRFSPSHNPQGPLTGVDPNEPGIPKRVRRGGSFLCAENYCMRYLPGARDKSDPSSAANHIGFRCVRSPSAKPPEEK